MRPCCRPGLASDHFWLSRNIVSEVSLPNWLCPKSSIGLCLSSGKVIHVSIAERVAVDDVLVVMFPLPQDAA